jgi:hypothetical protein
LDRDDAKGADFGAMAGVFGDFKLRSKLEVPQGDRILHSELTLEWH